MFLSLGLVLLQLWNTWVSEQQSLICTKWGYQMDPYFSFFKCYFMEFFGSYNFRKKSSAQLCRQQIFVPGVRSHKDTSVFAVE